MDFYMPRGDYVSGWEIEKIEVKYGVDFREDALELANVLVSRYYWAVVSKREGKFPHSSQLSLKYLKEIFIELLEIASARLRAGIDSNAEEVRLDSAMLLRLGGLPERRIFAPMLGFSVRKMNSYVMLRTWSNGSRNKPWQILSKASL
ncbi:hypothetical protein LIER_13096 [Lithospermum erythrorhizon]|uniref:Uncharacterized protein n=1 Tax=Lithospermum erythrorhizon TaxID=34254 RepID=A0AAV3PYC7_LITER